MTDATTVRAADLAVIRRAISFAPSAWAKDFKTEVIRSAAEAALARLVAENAELKARLEEAQEADKPCSCTTYCEPRGLAEGTVCKESLSCQDPSKRFPEDLPR